MSLESGDRQSVTRVEFDLSTGPYPFVTVSDCASCSVLLEKCLPRTDGVYAEFFSVEGARPDRLATRVEEDGRGEARILNRSDDGGLVEVDVRNDCPVVSLADAGAVPQAARGVDGQGTVVADVPTQTDASAVIESFLDDHPDAGLAAKRQRDSLTPRLGFENAAAVTESLTDRQRGVLAAAHEMGYYNWPRGATAAELAESLDISEPTLHKHLRAAERKLVAALFVRPDEASDGGDRTDR